MPERNLADWAKRGGRKRRSDRSRYKRARQARKGIQETIDETSRRYRHLYILHCHNLDPQFTPYILYITSHYIFGFSLVFHTCSLSHLGHCAPCRYLTKRTRWDSASLLTSSSQSPCTAGGQLDTGEKSETTEKWRSGQVKRGRLTMSRQHQACYQLLALHHKDNSEHVKADSS